MLETIARRLPVTDPDYAYYQELLRRVKAGFAGEQRVDYEWKEVDLACRHYILHDLELRNESGSTHQIDTLFICPYFAFVIEIKNIVGRIEFLKENHQFTRTTVDGRVDGFKNPFDQVKRHAQFLQKLLQKQGVKLPIVYAVISANPNMILTNSLEGQPIFHVSGLAHKMAQFFVRNQDVHLDNKQLRQFTKKLVKMHTPKKWIIQFDGAKGIKGVLCPHCTYQTKMRYVYRKWFCDTCKLTDQTAMLIALHDYRLMIGESISNSEFKDFFNLPSTKRVYQIIKSLGFKGTGGNKYCRYIIPEDILNICKVDWR